MINNGKFGQAVLKKIKEKKITPKPRWQLLLKNYVVWGFGIVSLVIGTLAFSVVIYMLKNNDWDIYDEISGSFLQFILMTLPYFWFVFLFIFILVADYNIKHTKKGYRYSLTTIVIGSVVLSIILGGLLHNMGMGQAIDDELSNLAPFYPELINRRMRMWANPDHGLLAGVITSVEARDKFLLNDLHNKIWNINAQGAIIPPFIKIEVNERVNMIGEKINEDDFQAKIIRPMGPGRGFFEYRSPMPRPFDDNEKIDDMMRQKLEMMGQIRQN